MSSSSNSTSNSGSSFLNTSTIIAIISTTALIYTHWSNLPEWVKLGGSSSPGNGSNGKSRSDNNDFDDFDNHKDANDDLATITAVLAKLQEMMTMVQRVCKDDACTKNNNTGALATKDKDATTTTTLVASEAENSMTQTQIMAAFYSLIHLNKEIVAKDPDYRDKQYADDREHDDARLPDLKELAEYLEYAHWAYEMSHATISKNCRKAGLDLITHDTATEPGRVGHYIALHHTNKVAIIGLKGTSTLSDVLTDLIAIPKEHVGCQFDDDSSGDRMRVHEGIFTAALWMADNIQPMIENLLVPLKYKVVICGHSLGAGTACLLGLELRSRIQAFRQNYTDLRVLAYATPPVLSYKASKACAPFVTSMVNNADVIPRSSVANLIVMNKLLIKINEKLQAKGITLDSWASIKQYYEEHSTVDDDLILTEAEMGAFFDETHAAPENETEALFVPGRCVVMWDKGDNDNNKIGGIITDCGMRMLRQVELSLTLVTDHFVKGYRKNLHKLIEQLENAT